MMSFSPIEVVKCPNAPSRFRLRFVSSSDDCILNLSAKSELGCQLSLRTQAAVKHSKRNLKGTAVYP